MNLMKLKDGNKSKKKRWTRLALLIISISALIYSAISLLFIFNEYKKGEKEYESLQKYVNRDSKISEIEDKEILSVDFESLKKLNEDIVGWISFKDTEVNYPIVKGADNSYYLNHTFNKTENDSGSIFMDFENDSSFKDKNTILYGHNMKNGSMFSILNKYMDKDFYKSTPYFWVYTESEIYKCEIFSAYKTSANNSKSYIKNFSTDQEYEDFLKELKSSSLYDTGITVNKDDILLTLSTCTNNDKDSRFVVSSKMVKQ
ncbi:class B sortase [Clostridium intestinale]|uniref:class B sortase n=1 Tax=Clostridium intestinale TaxID=36845 RepID=UPI0028EB8849|nr:class B sortase [Clostridium intestinale]